MSYVQKGSVTLTTDAAGAATGYIACSDGNPFSGAVVKLYYTKVDFDNGVDFTVTAEATGETIWAESDVNASAMRLPRQATHSTAGVAATYDGTRATNDDIVIAADRIKVVIAQGGDTKTGTVTAVVR